MLRLLQSDKVYGYTKCSTCPFRRNPDFLICNFTVAYNKQISCAETPAK